MGEFDRHNQDSGKKNETKKFAVVLVLGALLILLVAFQFMKSGGNVQTAAGAQIPGAVALPPPVVTSEMSEQALAEMLTDLKNDPAKDLLRQAPQSDHSLDVPPRNPFQMSGSWVASLVKPVNPGPTIVVPPPRPIPFTPSVTPVIVPPSTLALRPEDFKLSSIINGTMAIINGKIVKSGDIVGKARVLEIRDDGVTLQPVDSATAPKIELSMQTHLSSGQ